MRKIVSLVPVGLLIACSLFAAPPSVPLSEKGTSKEPQIQLAIHDPKLPLVVVVATGGTIAEKRSAKTGGSVPALSGTDLVAAVPELSKFANIGVVNFSNIDSSHMAPENWAKLSRTVDRVLAKPEVTGVVVTHGTDTMAEGSFFLDLTLKSNKPVVFTGAMRDASSPAPDGPGNILDAVTQVISKNATNWGVTVTLNQYVNAAQYVRKTQTTNVQTFESGEKGYLGYVFNGEVTRFNDCLKRRKIPLTEPLPSVSFLTTYAGDDGRFVRYAVDRGAKGIVIDSLGAGNVNAKTFEAVLYALSKQIPVVITSIVWEGAVEPSYGDVGGGADLLKHGCILFRPEDLGGPKARILLMVALAKYGNDTKKLQEIFNY